MADANHALNPTCADLAEAPINNNTTKIKIKSVFKYEAYEKTVAKDKSAVKAIVNNNPKLKDQSPTRFI